MLCPGVSSRSIFSPSQRKCLCSEVPPISAVAVLLIPPALDAVISDLLQLPRIEVQPVGRRVVTERFATYEGPGIAAMQLAVGFVFVLDLATQLVQCAHQFARRAVLLATVNRVVRMLHQQRGVDTGVVHL